MSESYYTQEIKNRQLDDEDNFDPKLAQRQINSGFVSNEHACNFYDEYDSEFN